MAGEILTPIQSAINSFRKRISKCISVAESIIAQENKINTALHNYNSQIDSIKESLSTFRYYSSTKREAALAIVISLEDSALQLNDALEVWQSNAIGRIGVVFDDMRIALDELNESSSGHDDSVMSAIRDCRLHIDSVCSRLLQSSILDATTLKTLGLKRF